MNLKPLTVIIYLLEELKIFNTCSTNYSNGTIKRKTY